MSENRPPLKGQLNTGNQPSPLGRHGSFWCIQGALYQAHYVATC